MDDNLPPGCSNADVDRAAGAYKVQCLRCDYSYFAYELNEDGICEDCLEDKE